MSCDMAKKKWQSDSFNFELSSEKKSACRGENYEIRRRWSDNFDRLTAGIYLKIHWGLPTTLLKLQASQTGCNVMVTCRKTLCKNPSTIFHAHCFIILSPSFLAPKLSVYVHDDENYSYQFELHDKNRKLCLCLLPFINIKGKNCPERWQKRGTKEAGRPKREASCYVCDASDVLFMSFINMAKLRQLSSRTR